MNNNNNNNNNDNNNKQLAAPKMFKIQATVRAEVWFYLLTKKGAVN